MLSQPEGRTLRALVVDDKEARAGLVLMLEDHGFEAVAVGSGEEALQRVEQDCFDVVFTDLRMLGLDGWEVAAGGA